MTRNASQRWFAWLMQKGEKVNRKLYHTYRKDLLSKVHGRVVEIGPGTGINFNYLPSGIEWIGVEPNEAFHPVLREQAARNHITIRLLTGDAQHMPVDDQSADHVISTLVLCSVPDQEASIKEIYRILKPGGKLIVLEHVAAPQHSFLRFVQNTLNPVNKALADGCNCNRDTASVIKSAGFRDTSLISVMVDGTLPWHRPHIVGYATK